MHYTMSLRLLLQAAMGAQNTYFTFNAIHKGLHSHYRTEAVLDGLQLQINEA